MPSRRQFLRTSAAAAFVLAGRPLRAQGLTAYHLIAQPARAAIAGPSHPETDAWTYNGSLPGPVLRAAKGQRLRVLLENRLPQPTTLHWHGIRLPNPMDGVPGITQEAVPPGGSFLYEFDCPDAGTYWYHPHVRSFEQVGRGLAGALIVEGDGADAVDRDLVWLIGDYRLDEQGRHREDFGALFDVSHGGRLGNTVTVNGRVPEPMSVTQGQRWRLRLVNAANARVVALRFTGHTPWVIALDGHGVPPHQPEKVVLGPGMRADLILDFTAAAGGRHAVIDEFQPRRAYTLLDFAYAPGAPGPARSAPRALIANPLAAPDIARAERLPLSLGGGAMGNLAELIIDGERRTIRDTARQGLVWGINGIAHRMGEGEGDHRHHAPLFTLKRGQSYVMEVSNDSAWPHPLHLHGHTWAVLSRNGQASAFPEWRDTVLLLPREKAELGFVADNPGDWMLHCHILEHQAGGMGALVRVI